MTMDTNQLELNGREVRIEISEAAQTALSVRTYPLYVQMELYFSCLIRLKLRFSDTASGADLKWVAAGDRLFVSFRPVMTAQCDNNYSGDEPPLTDFPITRDAPFTPRWLFLDYRNGEYCGEFGYHPRN